VVVTAIKLPRIIRAEGDVTVWPKITALCGVRTGVGVGGGGVGAEAAGPARDEAKGVDPDSEHPRSDGAGVAVGQ
jgi:hypothetical protein